MLIGHFGCSNMRRHLTERREECDRLCQQARNAKNDGWPDQADLLLNEAVRQRPDDLETRRRLADALWECGRQQEAYAEYKELAESHSRDLGLQQRLAVMCWTLGQRPEAALSAARALRLDPNCVDALLVKARYEVSQRDFEAAVATYIRLSRAAPDLVEAKLELAEVHVERGYSNQACTVLREALSQTQLPATQRAEAEWKLGLAYASADRWPESAQHLENSIDQRNATAADWQMLATAMMLAGKDTSNLQSKAQLAAARQTAETTSSAWNDLRDRMLVRGQIIAGAAAQNGIIRADFSRTAQSDAMPPIQ
jgi:tetratricopeptide (TPR) repeat protein